MSNMTTHFVIVPGQNGMGGENVIKDKIINPDPEQITYADTPEGLNIDLGQLRCVNHLKDVMSPLLANDEIKNIVIHATSQGTATTINYVCQNKEKISAVILESVLSSGNSAIHHTVANIFAPGAEKLPFSYYWMPYAAKIMFPRYSPSGMQAIKTVSSFPTEIPVIIIHATKDPQLNYNDALALYYALCDTGNKSVYLISIDDTRHLWLLRGQPTEISVVNQILKNHGIKCSDTVDVNKDLSKYQPDPTFAKTHYDELMIKEGNYVYVKYVVLLLALVVFGVWCWFKS